MQFAVDLLDVDESRIAPGDAAALTALGAPVASPGTGTGGTAAPPVERPNARDELWIPIVLIALLVLTAEWLVYERDTLARLRRSIAATARPVEGTHHGPGRLMGITFDAPLALLLLPPLIAVVVALHLTSRRRLGKGRRRVALGVRIALLGALVAALAGLQLVLPVDRLAVVFVVDMSDSVGTQGREDSLAYVREALETKRDEDVAGIIAFGSDALVERLPSELAEIDRIASTPVTSATDIGAALRLAAALFPDDAQKRIVLLSDGNDTTGSGQSEASLAAARGIQVETHLVGLGGRDEVLVERLAAPVHGPARRVDRGHRRHHVDGRAAGHGPPVRQRRAGEDRARDPRRGPEPPGVHVHARRIPGSCASGSSSRRPSTRSTRTTAPTRTRSSRASPRCSSSRATRTSRPSWWRRSRPSASSWTP